MPTLPVVANPNGCGMATLTRTTWFRGIEVIDPDALTRDMMRATPPGWPGKRCSAGWRPPCSYRSSALTNSQLPSKGP